MKFLKTKLVDVRLIEMDYISDERGFFARTFCKEEFKGEGLCPDLEQCNISYNIKRGTLRGMHYQSTPNEEVKLVRCTSGAIYDVVLDLRKNSKSYMQWDSFELTKENRKMLYIPPGCAHGFQTLEDHTEVCYQMSHSFVPSAARGICWDDASFQIKWPMPVTVISQKDQEYPLFLPKVLTK